MHPHNIMLKEQPFSPVLNLYFKRKIKLKFYAINIDNSDNESDEESNQSMEKI